MAKFTRFDPNNKKRGNHKRQTLEKQTRIREVDAKTKYPHQLNEVVYDDENDDVFLNPEPQQLNG